MKLLQAFDVFVERVQDLRFQNDFICRSVSIFSRQDNSKAVEVNINTITEIFFVCAQLFDFASCSLISSLPTCSNSKPGPSNG